SADLPRWLVVVFFMPGLNLLFFILLMIVPPKDGSRGTRSGDSLLGRLIPHSALGSAFASLLITTIPIVALILMGSSVLQQYGWGLFLGTPFLIGFFSTVIYEYHGSRRFTESLGVTLLALAIVAAALLAMAIEGAICILMASPIAFVIAL